ncbi:MAG: oligosaccharide flippase family protein [Flavobacteriales bacterium]
MLSSDKHSGSTKVFVTLGSRVVTALVGIIFVPIYIRFIGAESYGLVAFYSTMVASLSILDFGLSTAISRQIAVLRVKTGNEKSIINLIYSVEIVYWLIALSLGAMIVLLAYPIAVYWVNAKDLSVTTIEHAVMLMGAVFAFQFPISIYNGVMIGLEKQVPNAVMTVLFTIAKNAGVILILWLVGPTIENFFIWQTLITIIFTGFLRAYIWNKLKFLNLRAVFSREELKTIWRFAAGMTGISVITFFIMQIDKIVVSKMVLLEYVGYYNLAFLLSGFINQIISPIQPVIFPKFSRLVAENKKDELVSLYHKCCKWISIVVFPIGFILIFFAEEILMVWTHNPVLTYHTAPILRVCAIGTVCNCLTWMPYFYLLAHGITRYTIIQNIIASIILVPLLFWWSNEYGALGASFVWLTVNAGYVLITIPIFHHMYLRGEFWKWLKNDIAAPLLTAGILAFGAWYFLRYVYPHFSLIYFGLLLFLITIIYALVIPEIRNYGWSKIFKKSV